MPNTGCMAAEVEDDEENMGFDDAPFDNPNTICVLFEVVLDAEDTLKENAIALYAVDP